MVEDERPFNFSSSFGLEVDRFVQGQVIKFDSEELFSEVVVGLEIAFGIDHRYI